MSYSTTSWQTIVKENDLDVSVISLSEIEGLFRFEPEFYSSLFLQRRKKVLKKETLPLEQVAKIVSGPAYSSESISEYKDEGFIPIIKIGDVTNKRPIESFGYLDLSEFQKFGSSGVSQNEILMTMTGDPPDVGKCNVWSIDNDQIAFNQRVCKIKAKKGFLPLALYAYLSTEYARCFAERYAMGIRQRNLSIKDIRNTPIPKLSPVLEKSLSDLVEGHLQAVEKSKIKYKAAEQMLLKEINLEGYKGTDEAISVRNFTDCLANNRFDAEYWQPKYDEIEAKVSKIPQEKLGDIVSVKKGVEVGSEAYAEEGRDFIRVSDFSIYGIEDVERKISEELYEDLKESYKPKKGEVLFTKDGTIGISFALNVDIDAIVSGAFLRLKPKIKMDNNYLALVLNSFYCKAQIDRMSGGAIIAHLKPESAMQVKIPLLSEAKQEELACKVLEALRLRNEAKELLEKAKRAVEIFVEMDEKEALTFLAL